MRSFISFAVLALAASVASIPITPAAPELQRLVERMRFEGMAEHDISEKLTLPASDNLDSLSLQPLISHVSASVHSLLHARTINEVRDASGDIPPGSLDAPEMLPRAAAPTTLFDNIKTMLRGRDVRSEYAYEGKESEMRRPEGMRHWDTN